MIRILIFVLAIVGLVSIFRSLLGGGARRSEFKCADCIHCRKLFHDGSLCGFGEKEVFKTPAHIDMCVDYTRRG